MAEINKEEATINGVRVKDLSESGQRLFDRLIVLKKAADELETAYLSKQAALKELSNMLLEEVADMKAGEATSVTE